MPVNHFLSIIHLCKKNLKFSTHMRGFFELDEEAAAAATAQLPPPPALVPEPDMPLLKSLESFISVKLKGLTHIRLSVYKTATYSTNATRDVALTTEEPSLKVGNFSCRNSFRRQ